MKAKSLNFLGHPRPWLGKKKKGNNLVLVPASELTPLTFPLCRKAAVSVAFMWRNSPVRQPVY